MMLEHVVVAVTPGREEEFEASALQSAATAGRTAAGCFGGEFRRQEEDGTQYLLLIRWESIEAHMAWRETEDFQRWRELTHPFYVERPVVTHFHEPLAR
jgi:heme-degrading monooxygenase HmoA